MDAVAAENGRRRFFPAAGAGGAGGCSASRRLHLVSIALVRRHPPADWWAFTREYWPACRSSPVEQRTAGTARYGVPGVFVGTVAAVGRAWQFLGNGASICSFLPRKK